MEKQVRFLCAGMITCDNPIYTVPFNIMNTEMAKIEPAVPVCGGDALNVAKTLKKLGADVSLAGKIGVDKYGDFIIRNITEAEINAEHIVRDASVTTSVSFHLIDPEGKAHSLSSAPVHDLLCEKDFDASAFQNARVVYFGSALTFPQMDNGGIATIFRQAHKFGAVTAMDTALDRSNMSGDEEYRRLTPAFEETDIFLPSLNEIAFLTGTKDPRQIAHQMRDFGIKIFGIKMGGKGCYLTNFRDEFFISAFEEFAVRDTIGAGDSFFGAFLYAYGLGWDIAGCGTLASLVSSFNVSVVGATGGVPDFSTAMDYLAKHPVKLEKYSFL
jgi:sugar/nucleoside kinase (ribokinase family)